MTGAHDRQPHQDMPGPWHGTCLALLMAHLLIDHVSMRYGGTTALDDVSLSVAKGDLVSLLGPSGCGKTTLLRVIAGFLKPTHGHIHLAGRPIERDPPHRRNIGMVFQNYALFPHMDVAGNVGFGLRMRGIGRAERDRRIGDVLALAGLSALAARYPAQLSGGQQQRVALARALVIEPELLLLDEPLSNLDAGLRAGLRDEIRTLQSRLGITALFVSHDQAEALAISDRVLVMNAGRVVELATPADLADRPSGRFTAEFLGGRTVLPGRASDGIFTVAPGFALPVSGTATHVVLRASRLDVSDDDAPRTGDLFRVPGAVSGVTFLGDTQEARIAIAGVQIRVIRPTTLPLLTPGQSVFLGADAEAVSWIAAPNAEGAPP